MNHKPKEKGARQLTQLLDFIGAPEEIRTPDPLVRSQVLYPAELRAHCQSGALYGRWRRMQGFRGKKLMSFSFVRMPKYPECWSSCGSCASGDVFILELLVAVGDMVARDDNILTLETGKVALDIPSPQAGRVVQIHVTEGDTVDEGALLVTLESV